MKSPTPKKLPSGNYRVQLCIDGKKISITKPTAKECRIEADLLKARSAVGIYTPNNITLYDAIDHYIERRSSVLSPSTIRGYRVAQRNYFQNVMHKRIDNIDWQREVNAMAQNYAPKTVKNAWRFVVSVLAENGVDAKKTALPKQEVKEHEYLDQDQIRIFIDAVKGTAVEIPALLGLHSLRRSEIAALDWKNIDLKAKTISVKGAIVPNENNELIYKATNKNSASTRTVPIMIPALYDALFAVEDKTGAVCKMHPNSIYKAVNTVCKENDLPLIGVHGLRHSAVSVMYAAGLSEMQSMELCGYSDFATMRRIYTHLDTKSKEEARQKMMRFYTENVR